MRGAASLVLLPFALLFWSTLALVHALLGASPRQAHRYYVGFARTCMAVAGPAERAVTLRTGSADRVANMDAFARRGLELLADMIQAKN